MKGWLVSRVGSGWLSFELLVVRERVVRSEIVGVLGLGPGLVAWLPGELGWVKRRGSRPRGV